MSISIESLGTILGVWAHPDDETFFSAAVMATATRNNQRVVSVCATNGEGGLNERRPNLAITREQEMAAALAAVGVNEYVRLGYQDGHCASISEGLAIQAIKKVIETVNPDTILTWGPDGWTGHPDHQTVSYWTTKAHSEADKEAALYYVTTTKNMVKKFGPDIRPAIYHSQDAPHVSEASEIDISLVPDGEIWEAKLKAINANKSQLDGIISAFGAEWLERENQGEYFRSAIDVE